MIPAKNWKEKLSLEKQLIDREISMGYPEPRLLRPLFGGEKAELTRVYEQIFTSYIKFAEFIADCIKKPDLADLVDKNHNLMTDGRCELFYIDGDSPVPRWMAAVSEKKFSDSEMKKPLECHPAEPLSPDRIKENIEKGVFELGLVTEPVDTSRFETLHLKGKERWGALVKADDPLAQKEFVYPEDVNCLNLILPTRSEVRYILEGWLGKSFQDLQIAAYYNLGRNVAVMVHEGLGTGICFDLFADYDGLKFIPMLPPLMTGSAVCWKKNQLFSTVTKSFIDFLKNTY